MKLSCPRRTTPDEHGRWRARRDRGARSGLWLLLAFLTLALVTVNLGPRSARAEDGGIEIGPDPNAPPPPPRPARADSARRPATPAVPIPPQPPQGAIDAELERARERMAHEQERLRRAAPAGRGRDQG